MGAVFFSKVAVVLRAFRSRYTAVCNAHSTRRLAHRRPRSRLLAARPAPMTEDVCVFPWGNGFGDLAERMNFGTAELTEYAWIHDQFRDGFARSSPVTAFPPNDRGLYDMLGNVWVWNWTNSDHYKIRSVGSRSARPESLAQLGLDRNASMTMTGGCYLARLSHANLASSMSHPSLDGAEDIGFRLVAVRQRDAGL